MNDTDEDWALVLEDEPLIALELEYCLSLAGFTNVRLFYDCDTAAVALSESKPAVAIIDYRVKGRTSEDFVALLVENSVPSLVYSGVPFEADLIPSVFHGLPWLTKPQSSEALQVFISAALRENQLRQ